MPASDNYIAFYVKNDRTGRIEHREVYDASGLSPSAVSDKIIARSRELEKQFGLDAYDVYWEGYSKRDMVEQRHPDLGKADVVPWN